MKGAISDDTIKIVSWDALSEIDPASQEWADEIALVDNARSVTTDLKTVSLGKVLSTFIAGPMSVTGLYEEVQLQFGGFNGASSYMWYHNIAQFPVNIEELKKKVVTAWNTGKKLSCTALFNIVESMVGNVNDGAYGLAMLGYNRNSARAKGIAPTTTSTQTRADIVLAQAYGLDHATEGQGLHFRLPRLKMAAVSMPACDAVITTPDKPPVISRKILKISIFDSNVDSSLYLESVMSGKNQMPNLQRNDPDIPDLRTTGWGAAAEYQAEGLENLGIIQSADDARAALKEQGIADDKVKKILGDGVKYILNTTQKFGTLKRNLSAFMPTLSLKTEGSGILSVSYTSNTDASIKNVNADRAMKKFKDLKKDTKIIEAAALPVFIMPMTLELECVGCPFIAYSQQFFVDLGTNTTLDNVYIVSKYEHSVDQSGFKTKITLSFSGNAMYSNFMSNVSNTMATVAEIEPAA